MFHSILLPLDGSRFAETAIPSASDLARNVRAKLHVIVVDDEAAKESTLDSTTATSRRAEKERYASSIARRLADGSVSGISTSVRLGDPSEALKDEIARRDVDLVVLASGGCGLPGRPQQPSVAEALIRLALVPVLVIRHEEQPQPAPEGPCAKRSLLAPIDVSVDPKAAIDTIANFASVDDSHVTLLSIVNRRGPVPEAEAQDRRRAAQQTLDRLADELRTRGIRVAARVVFGDDIARTIVAEFMSRRADVLIIGRQQLSPEPADGTATVEQIVRQCENPVLVFPVASTALVTAGHPPAEQPWLAGPPTGR